MLRGFSGGKQVIKLSANTRNRSRVCLFWKTMNEELFILKTIMANYGWKWPLLLFLDAIATVDVLTPASKNDGKHIEIRTVHFAWPKVSFRFWENKQTRRRLLVLANLSLVSPWNTTWRGFNAINHKERGKMADILNEVCQVVMKIKANQKRRNVFNE